MALRKDAANDGDLIALIRDMTLFKGLNDEQIAKCLDCSRAEIITFKKGERAFSEGDMPTRLPVLIEGAFMTGRDFYDGKRTVVAVFNELGDIFGYEMLFSGDKEYDLFAEAQTESRLLMIPKDFLVGSCERNCGFHSMLISNMLLIMAERSLSLNEKLEIMTCSTLRQKIAKLLLYRLGDTPGGEISIGRQEMADYLNVARPSLSRELMKMQDECLINVKGRNISINNIQALEDILR